MKFLIFLVLTIFSVTVYAADFKVSVPTAKNGVFGNEQVFNDFGCSGENVSPEVVWENPPAGTKSFALTVYDPDAPTGSGWWHWVVTDIPSDVRKIDKGTFPKGAVQTSTDYGKPGYGGPCPPVGSNHRYIFTVFALKTDKLGLAPAATGANAGFMINMNTIGKAQTIVRYGR